MEEKKKHRFKDVVTKVLATDKELIANRKAIDKVQRKLYCDCNHKDINGQYALIPPQGPDAPKSRSGMPLYRCKMCKKLLDLSTVSEDELNKALEVLDRIADLAKMKLEFNSEEELKLFKTITKRQYQVGTLYPDLYTAIRKSGKKNKNRNNERTVEIVRPGRR